MAEKYWQEEEQKDAKSFLHKKRKFTYSDTHCYGGVSVFARLGKNTEFQKVYKKGKSRANKYLVMYVLSGESGENRYGFSVSKKVGNSVERHRITRLLRESVRKNDVLIKGGNRIVIVARQTIKNKKFEDVDGAVFHLLKMHKLLKDVMD